MDFSKIKMVVSDMDGTLLNSNHEVSSRFFELFEALKKKNIAFVAASGRQYHSMVDKLDSIKDDIIVIAENGALVKHREEVLLTTPITKAEVNKVLSTVQNIENAHPVLCCGNTAFVSDQSEAFISLLQEYYSEFQIVQNQKLVDEQVLKVAIYHFESSERFIYPFVKHLEGDMKVKVSGANWVDVSDSNAHKGHALKKVMEQYQVQPDEIMVFGDYNNDLEMLELSEYSFAMANAHPNVLQAAKFKTSSNNDFGVEKVLEKLV